MYKKAFFYLLTAAALFIRGVVNGQVSGKSSYVIKNVTVIPMNREGSWPDQTVIIENGIIKTIGDAKNTRIDKGATVIDGKGKYLMPGLFDMHVHFFYEQGEHKKHLCN